MLDESAPGSDDPPGNPPEDPPATVPLAAVPTIGAPLERGLTQGTDVQGTDARRPAPLDAAPVRHPARWVAMAVITVLTAMLVHTLVTNPRFGWSVVADYFTARSTLDGLWVTIELTIVSMAVGIGLGTVLSIMRLSPDPLVSSISWFYIWIFRGTPVIVQILLWTFIGALFPTLSFGIPFGPSFIHAVHRRPPRVRAQRGGLHDRDRAGRHRLGRPRPDGSRRGRRQRRSSASAGACSRPTPTPSCSARPSPGSPTIPTTDDRRDGTGRAGGQVIRPPRRAPGHRPGGDARERGVRHRPLRLGQVDAAAVHQPAGADRRRAAAGRRSADRLPPAGGAPVRALRARAQPATGPTAGWSSSTWSCSPT